MHPMLNMKTAAVMIIVVAVVVYMNIDRITYSLGLT